MTLERLPDADILPSTLEPVPQAVEPYIPGSQSEGFRDISVFLGLLISLGSAAAIGNIIAGVVLTYMRPFQLGDRVRISDAIGDIIEKTLLVTRARTPKNVDITIPNSLVLGAHIVNYSTSSDNPPLLVPHRTRRSRPKTSSRTRSPTFCRPL